MQDVCPLAGSAQSSSHPSPRPQHSASKVGSPATMRSMESSISRWLMPVLLRRPVRMAASFSRLARSAPAAGRRGQGSAGEKGVWVRRLPRMGLGSSRPPSAGQPQQLPSFPVFCLPALCLPVVCLPNPQHTPPSRPHTRAPPAPALTAEPGCAQRNLLEVELVVKLLVAGVHLEDVQAALLVGGVHADLHTGTTQ
jgi:hypothetical protein